MQLIKFKDPLGSTSEGDTKKPPEERYKWKKIANHQRPKKRVRMTKKVQPIELNHIPYDKPIKSKMNWITRSTVCAQLKISDILNAHGLILCYFLRSRHDIIFQSLKPKRIVEKVLLHETV